MCTPVHFFLHSSRFTVPTKNPLLTEHPTAPQVWDGKSLGPPRAKKFDILLGTTLHDAILAVCGK